jgi:hypothetical protein
MIRGGRPKQLKPDSAASGVAAKLRSATVASSPIRLPPRWKDT